MKILTRVLPALLVGLAFGCHAQVPPTNFTVVLTTTPNASVCTTTQPCTYIYSRETITAGGSCGVTTGSLYTPLNLSTPGGTSYTDATAAGLTVCYTSQSQQTTGTFQGVSCTAATPCVSVPAVAAGPFTVPGQIGAPTLSGATQTVASMDLPKMPKPTLAENSAGTITGTIHGR